MCDSRGLELQVFTPQELIVPLPHLTNGLGQGLLGGSLLFSRCWLSSLVKLRQSHALQYPARSTVLERTL